MREASAPIEPDARILVINVARIGDTLLLTPVLRGLKQAAPRGKLACIAHPGRASVLAHLPFLDQLIPMSKLSAPYKGWFSANTWDYALVYGYDAPLLRYALRCAKRVVAFQQPDTAINAALFRAVAKPIAPLHAVAERALLAEAIGITLTDPRLSYTVTPEEKKSALAWRSQHFAADAWPLVVVHPTSFPTKPYRNWPIASFAEVGQRIGAQWPGAGFVVTGGVEDRKRGDELTESLGSRAINYAGRGTLRQTAAILSLADLYIGVDTGFTHLAGALNLPMVALYHCLHRGDHLAPLHHSNLKLLEHPRSAADCNEQTPLAEITVAIVFDAASTVLMRGAA